MPGTSLDVENPAENRTVGNFLQATLVACFSRMASRCIQSGVITVTLSPSYVLSTGDPLVDSMAEWLTAGSRVTQPGFVS